MLTQFIKHFTNEEIIKDVTKINREYFLVGSELKKIIAQIKTKPSFAGIPLGSERGKLFAPSPFLLKKLASSTAKKIIVDSKGEWLFICGKDIFGKSVSSFGSAAAIGDFVLVENLHGECLGYGKMVAEKESRGLVVEHLFDIGDFLRRER